jgi:hypothetical protein
MRQVPAGKWLSDFAGFDKGCGNQIGQLSGMILE